MLTCRSSRTATSPFWAAGHPLRMSMSQKFPRTNLAFLGCRAPAAHVYVKKCDFPRQSFCDPQSTSRAPTSPFWAAGHPLRLSMPKVRIYETVVLRSLKQFLYSCLTSLGCRALAAHVHANKCDFLRQLLILKTPRPLRFRVCGGTPSYVAVVPLEMERIVVRLWLGWSWCDATTTQSRPRSVTEAFADEY
ncbi:hypothetical protein B0H16DRAFT_1714049 [Mycena metata]|uniref:Uncharacterized protein n=1 Tax=Mycena metata TaxID=1033252 RepID=A0AAD7JYI6_9AGAR|nr:hypothetical protein B0H16DRAFT_1714049 [Mycena metata]